MATRELKVNIVGDASSLERALGKATNSSSKFGSALRTLGKAALVGVGAAFAGMAVVVKQGFDEISEGQKVMAQTQAGLKSTGGVAKVTAKDITSLAESISRMTGIDDEAVQAGENMLLTFTNIRNEVGKGNDIFNQATTAITDMATRMNDGAIPSGEQLSQTAIRVGKALNDPVKGMTALSRVGVQFDESQQKAIKSMVKAGDTMGAQKLILAELNKEFGGSAKAAGETFPGQLAKLRNAFDEAAGRLSVKFLPALTALVSFLNDKIIPAFEAVIGWVGKFFDKFDEARSVKGKLGVVTGAFKDLGRSIGNEIKKVLFGYDTLIASSSSGVVVHTKGIGEKIADAFRTIDWTQVGQSMVDGINDALARSGEIAKNLADRIMEGIRQINWEEVGKIMGPGLAAAVVTGFATLLDPGFWLRNWEAALAIALVAFSGPISKLASGLGLKLLAAVEGPITALFGPRIAKVFVDALLALPGLVKAPFAALEGVVRSFFGKLGGLAVFTLRVLGLAAVISQLSRWASQVAGVLADVAVSAYNWAKNIAQRIIDGLLGGLSGLRPRVMGKLAEIGAAIASIATSAYVWAVSIGAAIIKGVVAGLAGLFSAVGSAIAGAVGGAVSWARGHLGSTAEEHAAKEIGLPLAKGVILGWILGSKAFPKNFTDKTKAAIEAARQAVLDAKSAFGAAFEELISAALATFDAKASLLETRTERLLRRMDEAAEKARLLDDVAEAERKVQEAMAARAGITQQEGESTEDFIARLQASNDAVAAAEKDLATARAANQRYYLEQQAIAERKALDDRLAMRRKHFEDDLAALQNYANKHALTAEQLNQRLIAIFAKYNVPFRKAAIGLGHALAEGLAEAADEVGRQAVAVRNEIMKHLSNIQVRINVDVVVPDRPDRKQHGGPVRARRPYIVGEAGPELFVPRNSGTIIPNHELAGGVMAAGGVNVYVYGDVTGDEIVEKVRVGMLKLGFYNPGVLGGRA